MTNKVCVRKSRKHQKSPKNHLVNTQSIENQGTELNPNFNKTNKLILFNESTGEFDKIDFVRNSTNKELLKKLGDIEKKLDFEAREDYKQHKTAEKDRIFTEYKAIEEKPPKIRTVLQTKDLVKEVGIFVGGDKNIDNHEDFEKKAVEFAKKYMEKRGLENKNILSISVHYDETTPHIHIQYNDYSFKHKTTGNMLDSVDCKNMTEQEKKEALKQSRAKFSEFQDLGADIFEMERGEKGSRAENKSKSTYLKEEAEKQKNGLEKLQAENFRLNNELENTKKENERLKNDYKLLNDNFNSKKDDLKNVNFELEKSKKIVEDYKNASKKVNDLRTEKNKLVEEIQQLTKNKDEINDSLYKNENNKIRLDIGFYGLDKAMKNTAKHYGIDSNEFSKIFDKNYAGDNVLNKLLDKAKALQDNTKTITNAKKIDKQLTIN
jgi:hypothetical protein